MWQGYHYKLENRWTPFLGWAPRWFAANGYPDILDPVPPPALNYTEEWYEPAFGEGTVIPIGWLFYDPSTPTPTDDPLEAIADAVSSELEFFKIAVINAYLIATRVFDTAEPENAWLISHHEPIEKLEVKTEPDSWVEIPKVSNQYSLMTSPNWAWMGYRNSALITGFDTLETITETRESNWLFSFVDPTESASHRSLHFLLHPTSRHWIPIHPAQLREDGFLGFWYEGDSLPLRMRIPRAVQGIDLLKVRVNGFRELEAARVQSWTSLDEFGLWFNVLRRADESNITLEERMMIIAKAKGQSVRHTTLGLASMLGRTAEGQFSTQSITGFVNYQGNQFVVHKYQQFVYVQEELTPDVSSTNLWRSRYSGILLGEVRLNGQVVDYQIVSASGSLISLNALVDNRTDRVQAVWKLQLWDFSGSNLELTSSFPLNVETLTTLQSYAVKVSSGLDTVSLRRKFKDTSPIYRWGNREEQAEYIKGTVVFA